MARILIVEDDIGLQRMYALCFKQAGFDVDTADNADTAEDIIKGLRHYTPDVMLLDILLPGSSGLQMLIDLKVKEKYPQIKILAHSNLDSPDLERRAIQAGADQFVLKSSIDPQELVMMIKSLLGSKGRSVAKSGTTSA
jgi:DNA-binding response OmpR family regulator